MIKLMDKKIFTSLHSKICLSGLMGLILWDSGRFNGSNSSKQIFPGINYCMFAKHQTSFEHYCLYYLSVDFQVVLLFPFIFCSFPSFFLKISTVPTSCPKLANS